MGESVEEKWAREAAANEKRAKDNKKAVIAIAIIFGVVVAAGGIAGLLDGSIEFGCDNHRSSGESVRNVEFRTLDECLAGIKRDSGTSRLKVVTDTLDEVSGTLANGKGFGCQAVSSGTKGKYVKGWYFVE